jgi:hypothetical protein
VPARSVTIGSWFSDCIVALSLAHRSRIMRVTSHQIKVISTHQKIGHFTSIKWYQLSSLIGEFYLVIPPSYSPQKTQQKFTFRLDLFPNNRLALHILSISVFVKFVCLRIQLLLVTCVSTFCSIFSCNPSFISASHTFATSCAHLSCSHLSVAHPYFVVR